MIACSSDLGWSDEFLAAPICCETERRRAVSKRCLGEEVGRLQVEHIEIDGARIHIGPTARGRPGLDRRPHGEPDPFAALQRLGIRPSVVSWAGGALLAVGALTISLTAGPLNVVSIVTRGGILISTGSALLAYGWLAQVSAASRLKNRRLARDKVDRSFAETIATLIQSPGPHQTVVWISRQSGLSPNEVIRGLALLRTGNELMEDVDVSSGNWFYWIIGQSRSLNVQLETLGEFNEE
jgi:hypothetical protein